MFTRLTFPVIVALFVATFLLLAASPVLGVQSSQPKIGVIFVNPDTPYGMATNDHLRDFDARINRHTDMWLWYEAIDEPFYADHLRPMAEDGRIIQLAWGPMVYCDWQDPDCDYVNQPAYRLKNITRGDFDTEIRRWAREMRDFGYPIIFRPMGEMNGDWTSWSGTVNGNSPADFVPAWRHIHDIFTQEGADNVLWAWAPNVDYTAEDAQNTFNFYYPGDNYTDYIGMNGYNWGTAFPQWPSSWQSFEDVFKYSYDVAVANTDKPVIVSETASTELGGSKAQWITDAFNRIPVRFPEIEYVTWFSLDKETDWRIDSSAASLEAFRQAVKTPDATPPTVSIDSPATGATLSGNTVISVSASDNETLTKVELYVGDNLALTDTTAPYSFDLSTGAFTDGDYPLTARAYDNAGNTADAVINVTISNGSNRNYYFGWYDNVTSGMQSWVIIGNPGQSVQHADVYIGGVLRGSYDIQPEQRVTPKYDGLVDGPVKIVSTTGGELLVSERVIFNDSFSETKAIPEAELSAEQVLTWYDQQSAGMKSWIVVGNHGSQTAGIDVFIANELRGHYQAAAGDSIALSFPGVMEGPVRVVSTNNQPLTVGERVVYGSSFNEVVGIPEVHLASEYHFTWYDQQSLGMRTWVLVGNQGDQTTDVGIYIADRLMGFYSIPAGGRVTPNFPGTMEGPVRVVSTNDQPLVVSQRSTYHGSFEEVTGTTPDDLENEQWFAWYDYVSMGMKTWILVGNQSGDAVEVDIEIAGNNVGHYTIPPNGRITPIYPGQMNGPVKVMGPANHELVVSQRTTYQNSFDELSGALLN